MKKSLFVVAALLLALQFVNAQNLTMEEAILRTGISTPRVEWHWTGDKNIAAPGRPEGVPNRPGERPNRPDAAFNLFTVDNNLHIKFKDGTEKAVTEYTDRNIVCGTTVSRNEFGIEEGWFVSPDSTRIAFYKKDESKVTDYPLYEIGSRTGGMTNIKYPMNGMASEVVWLGVYDIATEKTVWMDVTDFDDDRYLTCITWGPAGDCIYIQVLDRPQKHVHLNRYDAATGKCLGTLLTEENEKFVEPQWPLRFLSGDASRFLYQTDNRDGWKNLYLCSLSGDAPRRITNVDADVEYLREDGRYVYCSVATKPTEKQICRFSLKTGKMECLTPEPGVHRASFSADGKHFVDTYTSFDTPSVCRLMTASGKVVKELGRVDSDRISPKMRNCTIETGFIKSADGEYDNAWSLVKPADFDSTKKYPVILYVYGGPHLQMITNSYMGGMSPWDILMAQHGYIVFTMDNRGTPNHGAAYEKEIHRQCGKAEMEDQMEGIRWLCSKPWVDSSRIGVHGWSYGGFMTISLMVNYPEVFKVGVAGGPVIDWQWYEIMYGERYMETAATNPEGFASTSLIGKAGKLAGKLLICQGVIDNTVVWQHSLSFVEDCIKSGVQVDYFPYPTHPHNVRGKDRVHLMNKVTGYFEDYLK